MRRRATITATLLAALVGLASGWGARAPVRQHRRAELRMSLQAAPITRLGVVPPGPDPYKLVKDDIELIKSSIKKMLSTNKGTGASLAQNDVLTMAAREFTARQGKSCCRKLKASPRPRPRSHPPAPRPRRPSPVPASPRHTRHLRAAPSVL